MYRGSKLTPLQGVSHDWQWVTWMKTQEPLVPGLLCGFKRKGGWFLSQRNHLGGSRFDRLYDRFLHLACPPHTAPDFNHMPTQLCRDMRGHVGIFHVRLLKDIALFYFTCTPNQLNPSTLTPRLAEKTWNKLFIWLLLGAESILSLRDGSVCSLT